MDEVIPGGDAPPGTVMEGDAFAVTSSSVQSPPFALVPPPTVTRFGRTVRPVVDPYVERNKRSIKKLVTQDAKRSMLDDLCAWKGLEGEAPSGVLYSGVYWPPFTVHDSYMTICHEYKRVHRLFFGTDEPTGEEAAISDAEDESYVEGDSQCEEVVNSEQGSEDDGESASDGDSEEEDESSDDSANGDAPVTAAAHKRRFGGDDDDSSGDDFDSSHNKPPCKVPRTHE